MLVIYCLQIKACLVPGLDCDCTYTVAGGGQGQEDRMGYLKVDACGETILIYMYRGEGRSLATAPRGCVPLGNHTSLYAASSPGRLGGPR